MDTHHGDVSISRRHLLLSLAAGPLPLLVSSTTAKAAESRFTHEQKEEFLLKAKIVNTRAAPKGVTGTIRATLNDGTLTHEASVQVIDDYRLRFEYAGGVEMNFKDTWKFNVAAYKLDRILGLNMVPVTVERKYMGKSGSFTWWVDDVMMDEGDRKKKHAEAPDAANWSAQMNIIRVFDQLIHNMDRNVGNIIIDKDWNAWMVDHSRCFRTLTSLRDPKYLVKCDSELLTKLKGLSMEGLKKELGLYLGDMEIRGLLARRDTIVKAFEEKGPSALYQSQRRPD